MKNFVLYDQNGLIRMSGAVDDSTVLPPTIDGLTVLETVEKVSSREYRVQNGALEAFTPEPEVDLSLDILKTAKWEEIKQIREAKKAEPIDTPHGSIQCRTQDRQNLTDALAAANITVSQGNAYSVNWTLANNKTATLDKAALEEVLSLIDARTQNLQAVSQTLRTRIGFAKTPRDVSDIGWPA